MTASPEITIRKATSLDTYSIVRVGTVAVELAHRASCSKEAMSQYMDAHYNYDAIKEELDTPANIYHLIFYGPEAVGFSKVILNMGHSNIPEPNVAKLDRIYIMPEYFDRQLGYKLLKHNMDLAIENKQAGLWLFTWTGNERAVNFYKRTGFKVVGEHMFKVTDDHYNPNYHMYLKH